MAAFEDELVWMRDHSRTEMLSLPELSLMHDVLGRSTYAPFVFGNNAPDSGNAELLAHGSPKEEQKAPCLHDQAAVST